MKAGELGLQHASDYYVPMSQEKAAEQLDMLKAAIQDIIARASGTSQRRGMPLSAAR